MTAKYLYRIDGELCVGRDGVYRQIAGGLSLDALLAMPLSEIRALLARPGPAIKFHHPVFQAPIQSQEVCAAGVTYQRTMEATAEAAVDAAPHHPPFAPPPPHLSFTPTPRPF